MCPRNEGPPSVFCDNRGEAADAEGWWVFQGGVRPGAFLKTCRTGANVRRISAAAGVAAGTLPLLPHPPVTGRVCVLLIPAGLNLNWLKPSYDIRAAGFPTCGLFQSQ